LNKEPDTVLVAWAGWLKA